MKQNIRCIMLAIVSTAQLYSQNNIIRNGSFEQSDN
jgi:hypothetical protein